MSFNITVTMKSNIAMSRREQVAVKGFLVGLGFEDAVITQTLTEPVTEPKEEHGNIRSS